MLSYQLALKTELACWAFVQTWPQVLKSADVVVMSSHWEGLSLSNIEGMSSGRPFVASDVDGLREGNERLWRFVSAW